MEAPDWDVLNLLDGFRIAAATDGDYRCPALWKCFSETPRAVPTHGETGQVNMLFIDFVTLLDLVKNGQGAFTVIGVGFPVAFLRLRGNGYEGERIALLLDCFAQANYGLLFAVGARLSRAVKKEN